MTGWLERRLPAPRRPVVWIGWLRLGLLPIAAVIAALIDPDRIDGAGFVAVLAAAGAYAIVALLLSRGPANPSDGRWVHYVTATADLVVMAALIYVSGGAASPLRSGLVLIPVAVAIFGRPRDTLLAVAGTLVAYVTLALLPAPTGDAPSDHLMIGAGLFIAWSGALIFALSLFSHLRARRTVELSESRQRLVAQAVSAEERERRRLAVGLHDDPVQALLAARLFLRRADDGDPAALQSAVEAVDRTLGRLREAIFELHPPALEHSGLAVALEHSGRISPGSARPMST